MNGTGQVTLNNANGFTGVVNLSSGTLTVGSAAAIGSASVVNLGGSGTLQFGSAMILDRNINGSVAGIVDTQANNVTLSGQLSGGGFTKTGAGTLKIANGTLPVGFLTSAAVVTVALAPFALPRWTPRKTMSASLARPESR